METITLDRIRPEFFTSAPDVPQDAVWGGRCEFVRGRSYLIKGGSGSGKTSLFNFICGFRSDYGGRLLFDERDARELSSSEWDRLRRESIAALFQDLRLFPELTSYDNVMVKARLTGEASGRKVKEMLSAVGLSDKTGTKVKFLSLGQQQRVAFVRMMVQKADFYLLDEPVSHVDDTNASAMAAMLRDRLDATGAGLAVTSIGRDFPIRYDSVIGL